MQSHKGIKIEFKHYDFKKVGQDTQKNIYFLQKDYSIQVLQDQIFVINFCDNIN